MPVAVQPILRDYGCPHKFKSQLNYDRWAFANRKMTDQYPREELFKSIADTLAPGWFEWHPWTDKVVTTLCHKRFVGLSGCAGSAKTRNVVGYAVNWWLAAPEKSSVILCSTTMKMLRKRAWAEVSNFFSAIGGDYGNFVDSQTVWKNKAGDDKHAIFGMAVQEGSLTKVADNIKGIHTVRQMVVIDEATAVPAAIWDACTNLYGFPEEFIVVALGNARSRLDQFGRFIEPEGGWDSVSIETDEWEGKTRPEDGSRVHVVRFDFRRSPNVLAVEAGGKAVSKFLPTYAKVKNRLKALKERGMENDPTHFSNDLGFPPPEGLTTTVFTETMLNKHGGYERHQFTGNNFRIIGAYDQARTGDRPALRFAALGEIKQGVMGIEIMPAIILSLDATSKEPIGYQYLHQLRVHCANVQYRGGSYKCDPEDLGIDATNEAAFVDLCQKEWSSKVIRIIFSGACSDEPCSHEDERPACDVYQNKRSEMAVRTRTALESGQWKGCDKDTAAELTSVEYTNLRPDGTSRKTLLMDKAEYKKKYGASPDLFDSAIMVTEVARLKGFRTAAMGNTAALVENFDKIAETAQAVYTTSDMGAPQEPDEYWETNSF